MQARFHDGRTAAAHDVEVACGETGLSFTFDGVRHHWAYVGLEAEAVGDRVRLGRPPAPERLILPAAEWAVIQDLIAPQERQRRRWREWRVVIALTAVAAVVGLFVFVGMPLASGPLARATPPAFERKMGDSFEAQLKVVFRPCHGREGQDALYVFGDTLEDGARSPFNLRVYAVDAPMVNAFALPGGAIFVTGPLIAMAKTPDELAAVLAHEAAHVEKRHVMQAVWRSLGLGLVLDAVVGGGSGAGQQAVLLAGSFTDLRYSRATELEADVRGQQILQAIHLSSQGMAPFFERLAARGEGPNAAAVKELISSHPDTVRRAKLSRGRGRPGQYEAFSAADWKAVKAVCAHEPKRRLAPRLRIGR